jgi:branched-chain amino acid transport system permease protein
LSHQTQLLLNGLLLGGFYVSVALGFSLVWGILNIVNLAHGAILILGGYITYFLVTGAHVNAFATIPIAMLALFAMGYFVQRSLINRVMRAPLLYTFLLTFGLELFIANLALFFFKADLRGVNTDLASLQLGGLIVDTTKLIAFVLALLFALLLQIFLARSRTGLAIQAVATDKDAAQLMGVNLAHTYALTFGIGAATAGLAGSLLAMISSFSASFGGPYTLRAFVVVVLGGLGSVTGAVVGGLLFGLVQTFCCSGIGIGYQDAVAFGVLVLVLIVRPQGIIGKPG